jgi:glycosyltransferase involved in cell wall biosynthesis
MRKVAPHVAMLVNNPCTNDSRVRKEAEALATNGYQVTVVCRYAPGLPISETEEGVVYHRVEPIPFNWATLRGRICSRLGCERAHVLLAGLSRIFEVVSGRSRLNDSSAPTLAGIVTTSGHDSRAPAKHQIVSGATAIIASLLKLPVKNRAGATVQRLFGKVRRNIRRMLVERRKGLLRQPYRGIRRLFAIVVIPLRRRALRFLKLRGKTVLRWLYWLSESDEFGSAARHYVQDIRPDLIHAHDLATLPMAGRLAQTLRVKLIYDSHELEMHRNASYPRAVMWRRRRLERKYITRADAVITVSESIADHLRKDYAIPRPEVIMNSPAFAGVDTDRDLRGDLGLDKDVPLAIYVGSVTINRGIEQMLEALRHDCELRFATVGPRRSATEEDLLVRAARLGVEDRFHFVDPVPPSQVVPYIRTASVSVLPIQNVCLSYYYCMPNKLLESTFAGVPVAVANLLEMRRFIERYRCGLVMDETSPCDIARVIREVIDNRKAFILAPDVRAQISEEYGWPAQAARLAALYQSMLQVPATSVQAAA